MQTRRQFLKAVGAVGVGLFSAGVGLGGPFRTRRCRARCCSCATCMSEYPASTYWQGTGERTLSSSGDGGSGTSTFREAFGGFTVHLPSAGPSNYRWANGRVAIDAGWAHRGELFAGATRLASWDVKDDTHNKSVTTFTPPWKGDVDLTVKAYSIPTGTGTLKPVTRHREGMEGGYPWPTYWTIHCEDSDDLNDYNDLVILFELQKFQ